MLFFIKVDLLLNTVTLHRTSSVTNIVLLMALQIQWQGQAHSFDCLKRLSAREKVLALNVSFVSHSLNLCDVH